MKHIMLIMFLASCGSATPLSDLEPYTPNNIDLIGKAVFAKNGLDYNDFKVKFYRASTDEVQTICNKDSEHFLVNACAFLEHQEIVVRDERLEECTVLAHELTHIATGEAGHANHQFNELNELCREVL